MNIHARFLLPSLVLLVLSCAGEPSVEVEEAVTPVATTVSEPALVSGEMIVEFSEEMTALIEAGNEAVKSRPGLACEALEEAGVLSMERLYPDAGEWEPRHREAGLHRWYRLKYNPEASSATKAATDIASIDGVLYTEPVRRIKNESFFNDPRLDDQWHYYNDGSKGSSYTASADINVVPVWQHYETGSRNVIVAVIDSGVDLAHEDFTLSDGSSVVIEPGPEGSRCFVYDYPGYTLYPENHGTHVAGTIGAINGNGIGVCGVAGGEDGQGGVSILSCQIFRKDPSDPEKTLQGDTYNATIWAADHGAVISQNSWGYVYDSDEDAAKGSVGAMGQAIDYFIKYAGCDKDGNQLPGSPMKGGVVIFSAGNDQRTHAWPAMDERVISVGATSSKNGRAYYSNYGDWVDIAAPGGDSKVGPKILSTIPDNQYDVLQGTSMACPHVSGVAALLVSYFGGPGFTNEMLKERLLGGANPDALPEAANIGPLVDALGAFTYGSTVAPDPVTEFSLEAVSNNLTASWKVTADEDDEFAYAYRVMVSKNASDFVDIDPKVIPEGVKWTTCKSGASQVGDPLSVTFSDLDFDTDYYVAIFAYDYCNNYSALSPVKKGHTLANNAPVIETDYKGDYKVKSFEYLDVTFHVSDPDGHDFEVEITPGSEAFTCRTTEPETLIVRITGKSAPAGKYTAHIFATDKFGASTDYAINYELLPNHAPQVVKQMDNLILTSLGESLAFNLLDYFYDEDGERLQYDVTTSVNGIVHVNPEQNNLQVTALAYGKSEVTVTATDARGEKASLSFRVLVKSPGNNYQVYPNPVETNLYITNGEASSEAMSVKIVSSTGGTAFEGTVNASAFDPGVIDMTQCAPGVYSLTIRCKSDVFKQTVVKK